MGLHGLEQGYLYFTLLYFTLHIAACGAKRWLLIAETQVQYRKTSCEYLDGQNDTVDDFSPSFINSHLLIIISPQLHTHLSQPLIHACAVALKTQHSITFSVFELGVSPPNPALCREQSTKVFS
jgi:hypothetical protein